MLRFRKKNEGNSLMKKISIFDIKGGEILANSVITSAYQILLAEGTVLQRDYIENLNELGITEVYIQEEKVKRSRGEIKTATREIETICKKQVKSVLEKHIYQENKELEKLRETAAVIIESILEEENITDRMIEIKERNADIYEHSLNCCVLSIILGMRMNFKPDVIHAIGIGCLLHDMGLRYISVKYNNIDIDSMPENQKIEYKKHPVYGYTSIENEDWLEDLSKNIILYHHEKLDGTGYPFRRKKLMKEISVMTVCDTFDEMICGIGCKQKKVYKAIEYLKSNKNTKFDGSIVDEFLKIVAVYPIGSYVLTNTGEIGMVVRQNEKFPERPVIRILNDDGRAMYQGVILDLLKENSIFIEDVIN